MASCHPGICKLYSDFYSKIHLSYLILSMVHEISFLDRTREGETVLNPHDEYLIKKNEAI